MTRPLPLSILTLFGTLLLFGVSLSFATGTAVVVPPTSTWKKWSVNRGGGDSVASRGGAATSTSPWSTFVETVVQSKRHLVAAAVARSVSIFGMYPVDTIKTRVQLHLPNPFDLRLKQLYGGVGGSLLGQVPYGVLTFGSYEVYKQSLQERFPNIRPIWTYAMAAILGDLTGSGWLCPSEVIKQQLQAGMHSSTRDAFVSIWNKQGIAGLYQGYWGGVARDVPFRVAQLTSYEVTKTVFLKLKAARRRKRTKGTTTTTTTNEAPLELSPMESALVGALAGSFSAAVTSPLDRIKTLLMTNSEAYGGTVASCATKIFQEQGLAGFAVGVLPRVIYIAPSVALFFVAYEAVEQRLKHWK